MYTELSQFALWTAFVLGFWNLLFCIVNLPKEEDIQDRHGIFFVLSLFLIVIIFAIFSVLFFPHIYFK